MYEKRTQPKPKSLDDDAVFEKLHSLNMQRFGKGSRKGCWFFFFVVQSIGRNYIEDVPIFQANNEQKMKGKKAQLFGDRKAL